MILFKASWCNPCKEFEPIAHKVVNSMEDEVNLIKVDIDDNPELKQEHGIQVVPTMLFFKNAFEIGREIGSMTEDELEKKLDELRNLQPEVLSESSGGMSGTGDTVLRNTGEQKDS